MLSGTKGFLPWDGTIKKLEPFVQNERLRDEVGVIIFDAAKASVGNYALYLGYLRETGHFEYMPQPVTLTVGVSLKAKGGSGIDLLQKADDLFF